MEIGSVRSGGWQTQNRVFSGTGKIGGVRQPDYQDVHVYTRATTGIGDDAYERAIAEQAVQDQAVGLFQTESDGFNRLAKQYVSEVSPDRKGIIESGLRQIVEQRSNTALRAPLDGVNVVSLLLGEDDYSLDDDGTLSYARFRDGSGEPVAAYSNGGWTMLNTKTETARQIHLCMVYNDAWNQAQHSGQETVGASGAALDLRA
jgi:hypothetical protein